MPASPYKADPYASGAATQKSFGEGGVPRTNVGFVSSLVRLSRLRSQVPMTKSPVRGSRGKGTF